MWKETDRCVRLVTLTICICVLAYTGIVWATATVIAPTQRQGSLLYDNHQNLIGSRLIAQRFVRPEYLWPRPSAVDYNACAAGGSNLSPTNLKLRERAEAFRRDYSLSETVVIPAELVTASGSGLDPHLTLTAAIFQAERISTSRQIDTAKVHELLQQTVNHTSLDATDQNGLINVLEFNRLLDVEYPLSRAQ